MGGHCGLKAEFSVVFDAMKEDGVTDLFCSHVADSGLFSGLFLLFTSILPVGLCASC